MNRRLISRVELWFWDFVIQTLSRSNVTQLCLRQGYRLLHRSEMAMLGVLMGVSGMAGLMFGSLLYVLQH
jgi:hypothetical protein